ncbi:MAG: SMI1/KNR4 family protein [Myxococcota bacterium]
MEDWNMATTRRQGRERTPARKAPARRASTRKAPQEEASALKVLQAYETGWKQVSGGTDADVQAVEAQLGRRLPAALAEFLMTCGGGRPEKNFFVGPESEVLDLGIGYVLPLRDVGKKQGVGTTNETWRAHQGLPQELIPFAVDTGNANLICLRLPQQDVIYWVHDEPDHRPRFVAASLPAFLHGLGECPF